MIVSLDLTPWVRAPYSGVGQSAWRCFVALGELTDKDLCFQAVARDVECPNSRVKRVGWWKQTWGLSGMVFHSFELKLPWVVRCKRVVTVHDTWTLAANPFQDQKFQARQAAKLRRAIRRADHITVPSQHVASELAKWSPEIRSKVTVVPWAPLLQTGDTVLETPEVRSEVRQYLDSRRKFILCVACLEVRKNQVFLFSALPQMDDCDLVLVGHLGFGGRSILEKAKPWIASGRVKRFEHLNDLELRELYQSCFAVVLPSLDEGFGMPVVEAMAFGKPLLLSEIPALREIAGEAAQYFDPKGTIESFVSAVRSLSSDSDSYEGMAEQSRQRILRFSWERTATLLCDVYLSLG